MTTRALRAEPAAFPARLSRPHFSALPMNSPHRRFFVSIPLVLFLFAAVHVELAGAARPFTPLKLGQVRGLAFDEAGNLYVPDLGSATLYKVTPAGAVSVVPSAPIKHLHAVAIAPDG